MSSAFRDSILKIAPPWLKRTWGERWLYTFGLLADGVFDWTYDGVRARFPSFVPVDGLPALGRDRQITRGFAEPADAYRLRLRRFLDAHQVQGNPFELCRQIRGYLSPYDVRVRVVDMHGTWTTVDVGGAESILAARGNWDWDGLTGVDHLYRFWVIIYPGSSGLWSTEGTWGPGSTQWGDGGTWGTTATPEQVHGVREIVRAWRPEGTSCPWIIIAFDDASFDPTSSIGDPGFPDGTWGEWSAYDAFGVRRPTRNRTARYWQGVTDERPLIVGG